MNAKYEYRGLSIVINGNVQTAKAHLTDAQGLSAYMTVAKLALPSTDVPPWKPFLRAKSFRLAGAYCAMINDWSEHHKHQHPGAFQLLDGFWQMLTR